MLKYREFSYINIGGAKKKAAQMKKLYGYKPSVFKVTHPTTKKSKYVVVQPTKLKRT